MECNFSQCGPHTVCQLKNGQYGCQPYGETLPPVRVGGTPGSQSLPWPEEPGHASGCTRVASGPSPSFHELPTGSPPQALPPALCTGTLTKSPLTGDTSASWANAPTSWPNPAAIRQVGPWRCLGYKVRTAGQGTTVGGRQGLGVGAERGDTRHKMGTRPSAD